MRKFLLFLLGALIVVAVGVVYVIGNADRLVETIIENTGTEVVGTRVSVGAVELFLSERRAVIRNLRIANPAGFSSEPALLIGEISAQLDADDYRVIRTVHAGDVAIRVESKGLNTNYSQLQENIRGYSGHQQSPENTTAEEPVNLTIDLLELEEADAVLVSDVLAEPLGFGLGRVSLRHLSGTPGEVSRQVLSQITAKVVSAAALKVLEAQARGRTGDITKAVSELLEATQDQQDGKDDPKR